MDPNQELRDLVETCVKTAVDTAIAGILATLEKKAEAVIQTAAGIDARITSVTDQLSSLATRASADITAVDGRVGELVGQLSHLNGIVKTLERGHQAHGDRAGDIDRDRITSFRELLDKINDLASRMTALEEKLSTAQATADKAQRSIDDAGMAAAMSKGGHGY